jgi:TldD protein
MGVAPTGNGRRESYAATPMPRMTNTFMTGGTHEPDEIVRSIKKGIWAVDFGGGQVDITNGQFVFQCTEAYLVENGKVGAPVKNATLIGHGPTVMNNISMVGNDFAMDDGVGTCGKGGQSVPVGVGQPSLRIDRITVGGAG